MLVCFLLFTLAPAPTPRKPPPPPPQKPSANPSNGYMESYLVYPMRGPPSHETPTPLVKGICAFFLTVEHLGIFIETLKWLLHFHSDFRRILHCESMRPETFPTPLLSTPSISHPIHFPPQPHPHFQVFMHPCISLWGLVIFWWMLKRFKGSALDSPQPQASCRAVPSLLSQKLEVEGCPKV